jgi:hypothetical protein
MRFVRAALFVFLAVGLSLAAGCSAQSAVGVVAGTANDQTAVNKALFVPAKQPTLVLVESYENAGEVSDDATQLGVALAHELTLRKIAPIVDTQRLEKIRDENPTRYHTMHIETLGRETGASQVIYVDVFRSTLDAPQTAQTSRGEMIASVRVVDSATGETIWPKYAQYGQLVQAQTPWSDQESQQDVHRQMITQMARDITHLFYDWSPDDDK